MSRNPDEDGALPERLSGLVREFPTDLSAVVAFVLLADLVALAPVLRTLPLRIGFGLVFALFVPGYALVAALFPEAGTPPAERADDERAETGDAAAGIDTLERIVLSFGSSIAVVVLVALALNFTPWGIRLVPILAALTGVTLLTVGVAHRRRRSLPPDDRFQVDVLAWVVESTAELRNPPTRTDLILNVVLVVSFLLAAASVGFAATASPQGESFTEFYLLSENESGQLVADEYPTNFTVGESKPLVVGVGNREHEQANYTVVVELYRVRNDTDGLRVTEERELSRFDSPRMADDETWHSRRDVAPTMTGERLRLQYLLYRGSPPDNPTVANAYRETHLWITVRDRVDE